MMSHFAEVRVPIKRRYSCLRLPARTSKPHCQLKSKAVKMKWSLTAENQCQDIYTSRFPRSSTLSLPCTIRSIVLKAGSSTPGDVQLTQAGGWTRPAQLSAGKQEAWAGCPLCFQGQLLGEAENSLITLLSGLPIESLRSGKTLK